MSAAKAGELTLAPTAVAVNPVPGPPTAPSMDAIERIRTCIRSTGRRDLPAALRAGAAVLWALAAATEDVRIAGEAAAAAEALAVRSAEVPEMAKETTIYFTYFSILHTESASPVQVAASAAPVFASLLDDLVTAPPVLDDVLALLRLADLILAPIAHLVPSGAVALAMPGTGEVPPNLGPLGRWHLGHRIYSFACRAAAAELMLARTSFAARDVYVAADAIERAVPLVRALTAGMVHASNISSDEYLTLVRPTMTADALEVELTGGQNIDYRRYKGSLHQLVAGFGDRTFWDLYDDEATGYLAHHLDHLLATDLLDWDRHVELTARLVGGAAALHEREDGSAVISLRGHQRRAVAAYGHLLEHGEVLQKAFAVSRH